MNMEIVFKTNKLRKSFDSPRAIMANYGTMAKLVNQRLLELKAATSLFDISLLPKANLHLLHRDLKGCFALDVSANFRMVIEPDYSPVPMQENGSINLNKIIRIRIISVEDYH